jgi:hypothetical protein
VTLEDTSEDETGDGKSRGEREPDHVDEVVVGQPSAFGESGGVENHDQPQVGECFPDRVEPRVIEVVPHDVGADLDSAKSKLAVESLGLDYRRFGMSQRKRSDTAEPAW